MGPFTYRDLMRELGFETQMAFVGLPGAVMQETIRKSRSGEGAKPFFLHCDADVVIDTEPEFKISSINGLPFDPARKYMCATSERGWVRLCHVWQPRVRLETSKFEE